MLRGFKKHTDSDSKSYISALVNVLLEKELSINNSTFTKQIKDLYIHAILLAIPNRHSSHQMPFSQ